MSDKKIKVILRNEDNSTIEAGYENKKTMSLQKKSKGEIFEVDLYLYSDDQIQRLNAAFDRAYAIIESQNIAALEAGQNKSILGHIVKLLFKRNIKATL
jgi:hypothetical protein